MAIASSQEDKGNGRRRSNGNEEGENGAATVRSKVDEYIRISDLSGFGNLRAMMEAEALMKKKKRVQNCTNVDSRFYLMADGLPNLQPFPAVPPAPLPARNTSGVSNLVVYVSAPLPAIASSQEDNGNGKRRSTGDEEGENGAATVRSEVDEYTLISDLSGFDNLRAMMEAEALMKKKKRVRNYTNVDSHFYLMADGLPNPPPFPAGPPASLPASNTSGVSNLVVYVSAPLPAIASSQEDNGNGRRRSTGNEGGENGAATVRSEVDEHTLISDLSGFDNLRAMMEAEALMKKKKKKKKKKRVQNYTNVDSYFQEVFDLIFCVFLRRYICNEF